LPEAGIYRIVNRTRDRCYIGASINMRRRWSEHQSKLRHGVHPNRSLQSDWDADGPEAFVFEVVLRVDSQEQLLTAEESEIISASNPYNQNERGGTGPRAGYRHTEASKLLMSRATKGKKKPAGFGAMIAARRRGTHNSVEHRRAISLGLMGHRNSEATKAKRVASYLATVAKRKASGAAAGVS